MYYGKRYDSRKEVFNTPGNLYYVRLKTDFGVFYKVGFTTMQSLEARLAYQGNGHELLIDKIILFTWRANGALEEDLIHRFFEPVRTFDAYGSYVDFPLYQNGQYELYTDDVLGLDPSFSDGEKKRTNWAVQKRLRKSNENHDLLGDMKRKYIIQNFTIVLAAPFLLVGMIIRKFLGLSLLDNTMDDNVDEKQKLIVFGLAQEFYGITMNQQVKRKDSRSHYDKFNAVVDLFRKSAYLNPFKVREEYLARVDNITFQIAWDRELKADFDREKQIARSKAVGIKEAAILARLRENKRQDK
jgi:hypothetical protein